VELTTLKLLIDDSHFVLHDGQESISVLELNGTRRFLLQLMQSMMYFSFLLSYFLIPSRLYCFARLQEGHGRLIFPALNGTRIF
ncbi:MAG: hypothetical protein K2Q15_00305, partial [Burkholderiales bacterium]|nr:hypothetical protein [Burkholderiales bacterium]